MSLFIGIVSNFFSSTTSFGICFCFATVKEDANARNKTSGKKRAGITSAEVIEGYGRRKERERKVMQDNGISSNKCNPFFHVELYCIMCYIVTSGSE